MGKVFSGFIVIAAFGICCVMSYSIYLVFVTNCEGSNEKLRRIVAKLDQDYSCDEMFLLKTAVDGYGEFIGNCGSCYNVEDRLLFDSSYKAAMSKYEQKKEDCFYIND